MDFRSRSNRGVIIVGGAMLIFHLALKYVCPIFCQDEWNGILVRVRCINDIFTFLLWGTSIFWRVVQEHIRRALFAVVGIETFWLSLRTVKYLYLNESEVLMRYAWYLYYLPMLMLPAMCLKLALYLGKNDSLSRRKKTSVFPAASFLLFLIVITNDIHGLVFEISPGLEGLKAGNYKYGPAYCLIMLYMALSAAFALVLMYRNCRRLRGRFSGILPIVPFAFIVVICVLNMIGVQRIDINYVICFCISVSLEACLQIGIIQTNSGYRYIFRSSGIGMALTDSALEPIIVSDSFIAVSDEDKKSALIHPLMLENNVRLSSSPISYGHVFWQDDLSELARTINEISYKNEFLQDKNETLQAEYISVKREHQLKEKNRLYNWLFDQSESYIRYYDELTEKLAAETEDPAMKAISIKIAYVSAFIKRRINIIFLDEENKDINCRELKLCIDESLNILSLNGVECSCRSELEKPLTFENITSLYERFYNLTADLTDKISSIEVLLSEEDGSAVMTLSLSVNEELSRISGAERTDGKWRVKIK